MSNQENDTFAKVSWCMDDIRQALEDNSIDLEKWPDQRIREFLEDNQQQIAEDMVDRGWQSINTLLVEDK